MHLFINIEIEFFIFDNERAVFAGFAGSMPRERCVSMPSRARTSSEGTPLIQLQPFSHMKPLLKVYRPPSFTGKDISQSPPSQIPMSPASASTDSTGSSLSVDETLPEESPISRFGRTITPEETIAEEVYMTHKPPGACYLPMGPQRTSDEGYVDMSPGGGKHMNMSPAASSSSVTSGTPSTDMRFSEYPLERGISFFSPADDELNEERPARTYSFGSGPDPIKYCISSMPPVKVSENPRVRAFSVGSKGKKIHTRILPPHSTQQHSGTKSSSAPILSNSRNHSSLDPMDDLMEIDFSRGSLANNPPSPYVDMKPGKVNSGYVEMKPGVRPDSTSRTPEAFPYVDMRLGLSPAKQSVFTQNDHQHYQQQSPDYMDMDPRKTTRNNIKPSTSPLIPSASPNSSTHDGYMDMNFNKNRSDRSSCSSQNELYYTSPRCSQDCPHSSDYSCFHPVNRNSSTTKSKHQTNDGYVEMTLGHQTQPSLDSAKASSDYTNMSLGSVKKEKKNPKRDKSKTQPIQIQSTSSQVPKGSSPSSPMYTSFFYGRKHSTGTPPKMYLPLSTSGSPYSSLPRQRSRKNSNSRRDSKDSSSSSINTPSSSSTIFPISLNSPSSPAKPQAIKAEPVILKIPPGVLSAKYKSNDDYTVMDFEKKTSNCKTDSDYVNYNPATTKIINQKVQSGDYAIMKPGIPNNLSSPSATSPKPKISSPNFNHSSNNCFRPISENTDYAYLGPQSPILNETKDQENKSKRPGSVSSDSTKSTVSRPSSASSDVGSTSTVIGVNSRPTSSNSDRIRPASMTTEIQLHYASLDLATKCEEEDAFKSAKSKSQEENTEPTTSNQPQQHPTGCTYADIDFVKSDELNQTMSNVKIKQ